MSGTRTEALLTACATRMLLPVAVSMTLLGCDMPRDPEGTLDRVRGGTMRVGVVRDYDPWTYLEEGEPGGVEVRLVRQFAEELDAEIEWTPGSESELLEALERYELDLVVGGLTRSSPWQSRVGFTQPYLTTRLMVGATPEAAAVEDLSGRPVVVKRDSAAAGLLREQNAEPVEVEDPASASASPDGLTAGHDWQLDAWGLHPTGLVLRKDKHVMAAPRGENGWIVHLEKFLHRNRHEVRPLLDAEAQP